MSNIRPLQTEIVELKHGIFNQKNEIQKKVEYRKPTVGDFIARDQHIADLAKEGDSRALSDLYSELWMLKQCTLSFGEIRKISIEDHLYQLDQWELDLLLNGINNLGKREEITKKK